MADDTPHTPPMPVITAQNLRAGYGSSLVVDGVDLEVGRGEIVGLLGANGSGKSTLVRAITGQIRLWSGKVEISGHDLARAPEQAKAHFGLAVDGADLPAVLSGRQYLELVASIRGIRSDEGPRGNILERFGLSPWLDRPIAQFSLGTRAKISIAAALLGEPPLVILDESLNGLDPLAAWEAKRVIIELAGTGRHAVIVVTHVVEAVPRLCTRAVLLNDGRVARTWSRSELEEDSQAAGQFEDAVMAALRFDSSCELRPL